MKIIDCVAAMSHRALARTMRSIGANGCPVGNEERMRRQILDKIDHLTSPTRIAEALTDHANTREGQILVETLLAALLLTPESAVEEDHLFELVRGFEQSLIDEAAEAGASGYAGVSSLYPSALRRETNGVEVNSTASKHRLPKSIASEAGLSRHGERLLEATRFRFPKPGNVLHTLAEFLSACRKLQDSGVLWYCDGRTRHSLVVLPDEVAAAVKIVLGFELKPEKQRLLQDYLSVEQLARALQAQNLSAFGPKSDLSDRLVKSEVRPSEVLGVLRSAELGELCRRLAVDMMGSFRQDRIRAVIDFFETLVVEEHGVRGFARPRTLSIDAQSIGYR